RGAFAVVARLIERWRAEGQIGDTALDIQGQARPDIHARTLDPAVAFPTIVEFLAGLRYAIEVPDFASGPRIKSAHLTGSALLRRLLIARPGDDQVLVDDGSGGHAQCRGGKALHHGIGVQAQDPVLAKAFHRRAGFGVERDQKPRAGAEHNLRL